MGRRRDTLLPKAPLGKLLQKHGAQRVSPKALAVLVSYLDEKAMDISKEAILVSQHAGRKTVKGSDVKLAARK